MECRSSAVLSRHSSVSREYKAALRTSSYAELWSKVQSQLTRLSTSTSISSITSVSARNCLIARLSETLLEPGRETLAGITESLRLDDLLVQYFDASSDACDVCELLLVGVRQTRANYKKIRRVIGLSRRSFDFSSSYTDQQCELISQELGAFSSLRNPLSSVVSPEQFHGMNKSNANLLHGLIDKRESVTTKARLARFSARAGCCCLAVTVGAVGLASAILATHGAVVVLAAPGIMSSCFGLFPHKKEEPIGDSASSSVPPCPNPNRPKKGRRSSKKRLRSQIDAAAKGLYILNNDMGTLGSLVGRLQDEVEHCREWADIGAKNPKSDKILKEVVKELDLNSACFMDRLDELEEHIYLCLLTINKSRRSLLQEILSSPSKK